MKILSTLILCLLVTCKIFSQIDTSIVKTKYVFLTEEQSRDNIKELIAFDALKEISVKQEERIENFKLTISKYEDIIEKKDSIIDYNYKIISLQDEILYAKKPIKFHSYIGVRTYNLNIDDPIFYFRVQLEIKKVNVGVIANYQPVVPDSSIDGFYYSIFVEYKIF